MQKYLSYRIWLLLLVILVAESCSQIEVLSPVIKDDGKLTINETKDWVEHFVQQNSNKNSPYSKSTFLWKQAVAKQLKGGTSYVQVPLDDGVHHILIDPATGNEIAAPREQAIVHKNADGTLQIRIMELTPDFEYAQSHMGFTGDDDFSGIQLLKDWTGKITGGNKFEKGKAIGIITPRENQSNARQAQSCQWWARQYIYIGCTNRYNEGTVVGTVLYYLLANGQINPQRPNEVAPGSYYSCNNWQNSGPPELFQICSPNAAYDPFKPSYPSNPSNPFSPLTGTGAQALLELYNNKKALFGPCPGLTDSWQTQLNFTPATAIKDKLNRLATFSPFTYGLYPSYPNVQQSWYVQSISSAVGTAINLDNFSVFMNDLPIVDIDGTGPRRLTVNEFSEYVRLHINDFVNSDYAQFAPHAGTGENESGLWTSSNAVGAVIYVTIPTGIPFVSNDGSVITTTHTQGQQSAGWTFTTIHDAFIVDHPVSGNRTFGLYATSGGYMFYTQGADRLTNYLGENLQQVAGVPFTKADALWMSMQEKIRQFALTHGANATIMAPVTNRPNWNEVKRALNQNQSLSTIPCN